MRRSHGSIGFLISGNTLDFKDELKIQEVEKQIKDLFSQIASPALAFSLL